MKVGKKVADYSEFRIGYPKFDYVSFRFFIQSSAEIMLQNSVHEAIKTAKTESFLAFD